jgi:hypothetical protein
MPKILAMRKPFHDNATEGRLLSIATYETTNLDIPILLPDVYPAEVQVFRNTIARFLLEHWNKVDGSKMTDLRHLPIEPRLKQLAMPLSIVFQLWPDGKEQFEGYILARQAELRRARSISWEGTIFNLVYSIAVGDTDLNQSYPDYYSDGHILAVTPTMVAKQLNSKPKAITQGLTSIGFEVESRRLQSVNKKPRLYCVPDKKKWQEMVSRYYYSEDEDPLPEAPEVLRGSKYVVCPEASHPSHPSPKAADSNIEQEFGTHGTLGTDEGTRSNNNDNKTFPSSADNDSIPDYPSHPCPSCGSEWAISSKGQYVCDECRYLHPIECELCRSAKS